MLLEYVHFLFQCSQSQFLSFSSRIFLTVRPVGFLPSNNFDGWSSQDFLTVRACGPGSVSPAETVLKRLDQTDPKPIWNSLDSNIKRYRQTICIYCFQNKNPNKIGEELNLNKYIYVLFYVFIYQVFKLNFCKKHARCMQGSSY